MNVKHYLQYLLIKPIYLLFGLLPYKAASNAGGFVGRALYKMLKINKRARRNLHRAFPDISDDKVENIIKGMWENLGRVVGEFSHIHKLSGNNLDKYVEIEGLENIKPSKNGTIFFSGHIANWELIPKILHEKLDGDAYLVYRKANNKYVDNLIIESRNKCPATSIAKGSVGARKIIKALQKNKNVAMLVDQKQNDGIAVPFFGQDAMTAPAVANLALKYNCDLLPIRIIRKDKYKFKAIIGQKLEIVKTDDKEKDTYNIMCEINNYLESWIKQEPSQWFWVHNRWPKK